MQEYKGTQSFLGIKMIFFLMLSIYSDRIKRKAQQPIRRTYLTMNSDLQDIYDFMIFCKNSTKGISQQSFYFDIDDSTIESIKSSILSIQQLNKYLHYAIIE